MKLIDLHADTITALYYDPQAYSPEQEFILNAPVSNLAQNELHIDLPRLRQADSLAQFFVLWLNLKACDKYQVEPWAHFIKLYNLLIQQIELNSDRIEFVRDYASLERASQQGKLAGFACVEEGGFIHDLGQLEQAYQLGVRYITLVWNYESHIAVPSCIDQTRGLKPFAYQMVERMQQLGMLVDVSHLADQGVRDVLKIAKLPIIASHSNARVLCEHTRNLPDELIRGIADNGGVIGVNCVPYFLDSEDKTIRLAKMAAHIKHIHQIAGEDVLAIGNDFDGFSSRSSDDEIKSIADLAKFVAVLQNNGFSERVIEKIFHGNVLRVLKTSVF
jgi:membrane dipeptidase